MAKKSKKLIALALVLIMALSLLPITGLANNGVLAGTDGGAVMTVTKVWDDNSNADGKRPDSVTITLTPDKGSDVIELTLDGKHAAAGSNDIWSAQVNVDAGVSYTASEEAVDGYTAGDPEVVSAFSAGEMERVEPNNEKTITVRGNYLAIKHGNEYYIWSLYQSVDQAALIAAANNVQGFSSIKDDNVQFIYGESCEFNEDSSLTYNASTGEATVNFAKNEKSLLAYGSYAYTTRSVSITNTYSGGSVPGGEDDVTVRVYHYFGDGDGGDGQYVEDAVNPITLARSSEQITAAYANGFQNLSYAPDDNTYEYIGFDVWVYEGGNDPVNKKLDAQNSHVDLTYAKEVRIHLSYDKTDAPSGTEQEFTVNHYFRTGDGSYRLVNRSTTEKITCVELTKALVEAQADNLVIPMDETRGNDVAGNELKSPHPNFYYAFKRAEAVDSNGEWTLNLYYNSVRFFINTNGIPGGAKGTFIKEIYGTVKTEDGADLRLIEEDYSDQPNYAYAGSSESFNGNVEDSYVLGIKNLEDKLPKDFDPNTQEIIWYSLHEGIFVHVDGHIVNKRSTTVTYHSNYDTDATKTITLTKKDEATELFPHTILGYDATELPAREGYTFTGWKDGSGNSYSSAAKIEVGSDAHLYAQWKINSYNVTYTITGNTPAGFTEVNNNKTGVNYGTTVNVANGYEQVVANGGVWTFSGWATSDATVADGSFAMPDKDVKFTGSWSYASNGTYNVVYRNGGENTYNGGTYDTGAAHTVLNGLGDTGFTKEGYTFTGWLRADGQANGAALNQTGTVYYDAQWEANDYTLTVHYVYAAGGTAAEDHTETVACDATYSVVSPAINGYTADIATVTGKMPAENVEVTVTYAMNYVPPIIITPTDPGPETIIPEDEVPGSELPGEVVDIPETEVPKADAGQQVTGDSMTVWIVLLVLSAGAIIALIVVDTKRKNSKSRH